MNIYILYISSCTTPVHSTTRIHFVQKSKHSCRQEEKILFIAAMRVYIYYECISLNCLSNKVIEYTRICLKKLGVGFTVFNSPNLIIKSKRYKCYINMPSSSSFFLPSGSMLASGVTVGKGTKPTETRANSAVGVIVGSRVNSAVVIGIGVVVGSMDAEMGSSTTTGARVILLLLLLMLILGIEVIVIARSDGAGVAIGTAVIVIAGSGVLDARGDISFSAGSELSELTDVRRWREAMRMTK